MSALRHWFERSGLAKKELARLVTERARAEGHLHVRPDGARVRGWLRGEQPREPIPALLAEILSERCRQELTLEDLGFGSSDTSAAYRGPVEIVADLEQLTAAHLAAGPLPPPEEPLPPREPERILARLEGWAYGSTHQLTIAHAGKRLGASDAARLAEHTKLYRELDNAHGGGVSLHAATGQLAWAVGLLRNGTYTEPAGRQLYRELADLAGVVGWMSHDAAQWTSAVRYLTLAVHAAREGQDPQLTAHLLQCLARVWGYLGRPDVAADCIALALYRARTAHPVLRAGLHSLAARFAALQGEEAEALRHVHMAGDIFHEQSTAGVPGFSAYLDAAELDSTLGEVLLFLSRTSGRPHHAAEAVRLLHSAVHHRAPERARSRAFDHIASARSLLVVGDHDGALTEGLRALAVGADLESVRVRKRFADLAGEATRVPSEVTEQLRAHITDRVRV
ncbi:hypothetical protein [Nocardiopsis dassonvillei]|uniref:hypothetical protein n=1 Tax=Nocardiopsis dassonvillei TaxID=2014 RepID=UPI003644EE20